MSYATQLPGLYLLDTKKGRSVFTSEFISSGSLIELCPIIYLSAKDTALIHETSLHDYYFLWDESHKTSAIALGYGSLYNHSDQPNADFEIILDEKEIRIMAIEDIVEGSEITFNYISRLDANYKLWFDPK